MNNEKISVELELQTKKFTDKIKETTKKISEFGEKAKEQFNIGKYMDISSAKSRLEELKRKLKELQDASDKVSIYGGISDNDNINKIKQEINEIEEDISAANTTMGKFGQASRLEGLKKQIDSIKSKFGQLKNSTDETLISIKNGFNKGIKSIKKFAFSLFGVRTAFSIVSKAMSSYMSMDNELSEKIQSVWKGLGAQLAPILEYLVNLFSKFLTIVNAAVRALTGIDMVARANAKSLSKQAKAGKEASKALAGFDEITNLDTSSGSGISDSGLIALEPVDTSAFSGLKSILEEIKLALEPVWETAQKTFEVFKKWALSESFQTALDRVKTFVLDIWGYLKDAIAWFNDMYQKYILPVIEELLYFISDLITAIGDVWNAIKPVVDKIWENFKKVMEPVIESLGGFVKGIITSLRGVLQFVSGVFTGDWKKAWEGIKLIFKGIWDSIWSVLKGILNLIIMGVENLINTCIRSINKLLKPLSEVGNTILKAVGIKSFSFSTLSEVKLARLDVGTNYVPSDQLAMIHKGEAVIPKKFNEREYFGGTNDETNALLRELITTLEEKDMSVNLDSKTIGKTAQNYINSQSRIMGRSVI